MSEYVIVTDSSADLSAQMVEELGVVVLPLSFTLEGKTYHDYPDAHELPHKELYQKLRNGGTSTTAAVNVGEYTTMLKPILEEGKDVLILSFSSGLSATYQSSVIAAQELSEQYPQRTVCAVDTLSGSLGQGMLIWYAVQEKNKGKTLQEVRDWVEANRLYACHRVMLDDLQFLKRGGRISGTSAAVGSLLGIKPIVHVNDEGKLVNVDKVRGRERALKSLVDHMEKTAINPAENTVFISHSDCLADAELLRDEIAKRMGVKQFFINFIGPVIGSHTGPGTVVLFYMGTPR